MVAEGYDIKRFLEVLVKDKGKSILHKIKVRATRFIFVLNKAFFDKDKG